jgi:hypothetical protein
LAGVKTVFCAGYGRHCLIAETHEKQSERRHRLRGEHAVLEEAH